MSQGSLFDRQAPTEPSEFETALGEVMDALDKWQLVLPADEWRALCEQVSLLFRFTIVEEKEG